MGYRNRLKQDNEFRTSINTIRLINRLEKHAFATKVDDMMTPSQVMAALGLLRKTVPDLLAVKHKHEGKVDLNVVYQTVEDAKKALVDRGVPLERIVGNNDVLNFKPKKVSER